MRALPINHSVQAAKRLSESPTSFVCLFLIPNHTFQYSFIFIVETKHKFGECSCRSNCCCCYSLLVVCSSGEQNKFHAAQKPACNISNNSFLILSLNVILMILVGKLYCDNCGFENFVVDYCVWIEWKKKTIQRIFFVSFITSCT